MTAVVFVERHYGNRVPPMARHAASLGYEPFWIAPRGTAAVEGIRILETDRWDEATIRALVGGIERELPIAAFTCQEPYFTPGSLLGAVVAELARERFLVAHDPAAWWRSLNKFLTRDSLRAAGVRTVDFGVAHTEEEAAAHAARIGYPIVLKPLCGVGSHLILRCLDERQLRDRFRAGIGKLGEGWLSRAAGNYELRHRFPDSAGRLHELDPSRSLLVERYIPGREASVECVVVGAEPHALVVHDKIHLTERDATVLEDVLVTPPARFSGTEIAELRLYAEEVLRAVGLRDSFAHVELRYERGVGPQLIEVNPRLGGAYIARSVATFAGIDIAVAVVDLALGRFVLPEPPSVSGFYGGFAFFSPRTGTLARVDGLAEVRGIRGMISATQEIPTGACVGGDEEECFVVVCWARRDDAADVLRAYDEARRALTIEVA